MTASAFAIVTELVNTFHAGESHHLNPAYQEQEAQRVKVVDAVHPLPHQPQGTHHA